MSHEVVDKWQIIEISHGGEIIYKLFATWYGGYLGSDEWRLNSGITRVEFDGANYRFYGQSGSCYVGHKDAYGSSGWSQGIAMNLVENARKAGVEAEILSQTDAMLVIQTFLEK